MNAILEILRTLFFTKFIGEIDLYTLLSSLAKYIFVFIVLYFIYIIVKMIFLDIRTVYRDGTKEKSFLLLIKGPESKKTRSNQTIILENFLSLGRDSENNLILDESYISKRHAVIIKKDDGYYIEDLNSSNGTFLNGKQVMSSTRIYDQDIIELGSFQYRFNQGDEDHDK